MDVARIAKVSVLPAMPSVPCVGMCAAVVLLLRLATAALRIVLTAEDVLQSFLKGSVMYSFKNKWENQAAFLLFILFLVYSGEICARILLLGFGSRNMFNAQEDIFSCINEPKILPVLLLEVGLRIDF